MSSKHFSDDEMKCKCAYADCTKLPHNGINPELFKLLEKIREHFGKPVTINCAYRCKKHNADVGGEKNSQHLYGNAADIVVQGIDADKVFLYTDSINPCGGVGRYNTFTHVDVRGSKARWDYRKKKK